MFTLIEGGDVYAPERLGRASILLAGDRIARVGPVDPERVAALDLGLARVDAGGCVVIPGLIDPHEHLIGAAGEQGFASRTADVTPAAIVGAGITTVVGCLGTDTTARHLTSLLAKTRQLEAGGISAWMFTGGFPVPPPTLTGSVRDDLILIDKVIGVGEIAIADLRSSEPTVPEVARLVSEAYVGGTIAGKAGVTHFHTGPTGQRLGLLHAVLDQHDVPPDRLYPTHVNRSEELLDDAISLAQRGAWVDVDTVEEEPARWLQTYYSRGGPPDRLTVSSDAQTLGGEPGKLLGCLVEAVRARGIDLAQILPAFTSNVARALHLAGRGSLRAGQAADVVVLDRARLEVVHVFANGQWLVKERVYRE
ncbi:MAG TPA: beta-aspartyl-peptidase [Dehalococcoidia bacterium]|nr:beta-aspartyl-peptidase [Dehalococcoidia bacterium]